MLFKPTGTDPGHPQIHSCSALAPAKRTSVKKSLVLEGERDRVLSRHRVKNFHRLSRLVLKWSPGMQISSIQLASSLPIMSSSEMAISSPNVEGAPVRPNGMRR